MNIRTKFLIPIVIIAIAYGIAAGFNFGLAQTGPQIDASAYIVSSKDDEAVSNGEYDVKFSIYGSESGGSAVWTENQKIYIQDGVLNAYLGSVNPLPNSLNFGETEYYLGIKIGADSEMVPRKKIESVPAALNAYTLRGATTGTAAGDIPQLSSGGKMDIKLLPTGTSGKKLVLANSTLFDDIHPQNTDTGTDSLIFNIGSGDAVGNNNFDLTVSSAAHPPALRYSGTADRWQLSNNGTTFTNIPIATDIHDPLTLAGAYDYLTLSGQEITLDQIDLTTDVTGALPVANGGTGISAYAAGDILYASGAANLTALGIGANGEVLVVSGGIPTWSATAPGAPHNLLSATHFDTTAAAAVRGDLITGQAGPVWARLTLGTSGYILRSNGTDTVWAATTNITELGTITTGTWNGSAIQDAYVANDITLTNITQITNRSILNTTDTLTVARGGTGATTLAAGGILYGNDAGAVQATAILTNGQLLIGDGSGVPTLSTLTQGTGITITNGAGSISIASTLGTAIDTSEITDGTILEIDLDATNAPTDGQVLTFDNATGGFTWVSSGAGGIGDITAVGNVTTGDAFTATGTAGTSLYFYDADGRGQLTIADLSAVRTYTLPDESGTICTSGSICSGYQASATALTTTTNFGGDVSGTYGAIAVADDSHSHTAATLPGTISYLGASISASEIDADSLDFTEFQDTLDLDADLILNQTAYTWTQNFTGTTATGLTYNGNSLTSGGALSLASTAAGFTGTLANITLSGNNAANTGTLLKVSSTGASNAGTVAMITNLGTGLSFRVNDETGDSDTTPFVIDASGNVGIGDSSPDTLLDILDISAANTQLTMTNTNVGDYDVQLGFQLAEGTNTFTLGVDDSDSDKFKISTTALGTNDRLVIDSSGSVGIGDTTPASLLTVGNGDLFQVDSSGQVQIGANGQDGQLTIYSEQGATDYSIVFQPNAAMTQTTTYTLPADDGDSGMVLMTNGTGALSWSATAAATPHNLFSATHSDVTGTPAQGDVIYRNGSSQWTNLGAGTSGYFLMTQGAGANPTWSQVTTHNPVTLAGAYDYLTLSTQQITLNQIDLATDVTGLLPPANGGTGVANGTSNTLTFTGNYSLGLTLTNTTSLTLPTSGTLATTAQIISDHGALSGLTDDDHTQYALLAGRSGGQTLIGGTAANNTLTIQGTSASGNTSTNANLTFKVGDAGGTTAMTILNSGNVGIGQSSPAAKLDILNSSASNGLALLGTTTLQQATGNEVAYQLNYTTNKATSGNDTGLLINMTDTASPGSSYLIDAEVGAAHLMILNVYGTLFVSSGLNPMSSNQTLQINNMSPTAAISTGRIFMGSGTDTSTTGNTVDVKIAPTYNQTSGTAANTDLLINRTQTAIGSGLQYLIDAQVGGTSKFNVSNTGVITAAGTINDAPMMILDSAGYNAGLRLDRPDSAKRAYVEYVTNSSLNWATGLFYNSEAASNDYHISTSLDVTGAKMTVTTGGNVGIGYATPASLLEISDTDANPVFTITNRSDSEFDPSIAFRLGAAPSTIFTMGVDDSDSDQFKISYGDALGTNDVFVVGSTGAMDLGTGATSMAIDANGQVGIGITASLTATLHLVNNEASDATAQALLVHLDNDLFTGSSATAANMGGGLVITADQAAGAGFDFLAAVSDADGTPDTEFRLRGDGNAFADGSWAGSGADYAEYFYTSDSDLKPGEMVCLDPSNNERVVRCQRERDSNVIGIVSTNPAFIGNNFSGAEAALGEVNPNYKLVGLIGQVAAKVSGENGKIQPGDSLTPAGEAGYAMKADAGDSTVGVAMEKFDGKKGTIKVLISRRNKTLTVEKVEQEVEERIAAMKIEDEVETRLIASLQSLQSGYDARVKSIEDLMAEMQKQIDAIRVETRLIASLQVQTAQIDANKTDIDYLKLLLGIDRAETGSVNILGKLEASEVVAGVFTVKVIDPDTKTVGTAVICPAEKIFDDNDKKCVSDPDGDGKSVIVKTKAVTSDSKIFVTAERPAEIGVNSVEAGESFKIEVSQVVDEDLKVNWWLVEEK